MAKKKIANVDFYRGFAPFSAEKLADMGEPRRRATAPPN